MNDVFKKFAQEIKFVIPTSFENVSIFKAVLRKENNVFDIVFKSDEIPPFADMQKFMVAISTNFRYKTSFVFEVVSPVFEENKLLQYFSWTLRNFLKQISLEQIVSLSKKKVKDKELTIWLKSQSNINTLMSHKLEIERIISKFGFDGFSLNVLVDHEKNEELDNLQKEFYDQVKSTSFEKSKPTVIDSYASKKPVQLKISELKDSELTNVSIEGQIVKLETRKTRTNSTIIEMVITDFEEAIYVKLFNSAKGIFNIDVGQWVSVIGRYQIDNYTNQPTILASKIVTIGNKKHIDRLDEETDKRIELGARTQFSTMDGIVAPSTLVERALKWKHRAISIMDTNSVQGFPEFYAATKKAGIKGIYGASLEVINKNNKALYNHISEKKFSEDKYVVFDIETTGLSPIFDDIIEFGAVKIEDGQIIDRKQFFLKPEKEIPSHITELTNISNQTVKDGLSKLEGLKQIVDYVDGYTLVAHNANFDITFINQKLDELSLDILDNPVVDTLVVARILFPEAKKFRLESVASKLAVEYETDIAHRADYDAEVLAKIWIKFLQQFEEKGFHTHGDLYNFTSDELYFKTFSNEVSLIVKNQNGLKQLFKFISKSLTQNYFKSPKLFFEDLLNQQDILIGSGAIKSRIMDRLFYGSKKQVIDEIKNYDYIEVQPPRNYIHLVNRKMVTLKEIEEALEFLILAAQDQGKIVVVTGDVRYLDKRQKTFHDVYISAKGVGGERHYLFQHNEKNPQYPTQNFLTTKEMLDEMKFLKDVNLIHKIVVENTHKIVDQIEEIHIIKDKLFTPKFEESDSKLENLVYSTARNIYGENLPSEVEERIKKEIVPIKKYGFSVIYWIAHLLVKKSLDDGYLVGSRGSVGSSFVATMAGITEVNPLPPHYVCSKCKIAKFPEDSMHLNSGYDLPNEKCSNCQNLFNKEGQNIPFETFLGFDANKVPDIDLNFSGEYQETIHDEVKRLFGESHSFRAGTISTVAERTAYGYAKNWAEENNKILSEAYIDFLAKNLVGTKRTTGQHPGGIIVIPGDFDVEDFTPINYPANDIKSSWKTTHFDFHAIHDNVLKLDLLGHDDPTAIKFLERLTGVDARKDIPFYDPKIISLFSSTEALNIDPKDINGEKTGAMGIPEFGTKFVRGMLKKSKVKSFGDLIAISGLSHGTDVWANNAEQLVSKENKTLNEVISCRDNIMTDLIAKNIEPLLAFEIMERVRKGKGVTLEQETIMIDNGVESWYIDSLKKIKYMFPKAHATAYVMMAWRIAWFKLYHPLSYYAAYFTTRADVFDIETAIKNKEIILGKLQDYESRKHVRGPNKLSNKEEEMITIFEIILEAKARGVKINNISLEKSEATGWVIDNASNSLYPPFSSIDGLGFAVAESIIRARNEKFFSSIEDFQKRTSVNKTSIEKLKNMDVFSGLAESNQISFF